MMGQPKVDDKVATSLGIENAVVLVDKSPKAISVRSPEGVHPLAQENPHAANDFSDVRKNLKELIDVGKTALDGILQVASEGESPRAYEVAAIIMRQIADANASLIGLHKLVKDIRHETAHESKQSAQSITNNAIYLGSTKDLQEYLRVQRLANQTEIIDNDPTTR
jgi:Terminase DNA packaging enzyme